MKDLRLAVLATVCLGHAAAAVAGVLPALLALLAVALTAAGCALAVTGGPSRARLLRLLATVLAGLLALAVLPQALAAAEPRELLGPLLVGIAVVQSATWATRRDLQTGLLCGVGLLVLGASFAPDVLIGLPLLAGWGAALAAGILLGRARTLEAADVVLPAAGPVRTPVLSACALAAVLGLIGFLLVPASQDAGLRSRLAGAVGSNVVQATRAALGAGVFSSGRVDLRLRGDLSDRPLLEVPADSPKLWRGAVYDTWDGRAWTASDRRLEVVPGPPYRVADDPPTRTDEVRLLAPTDGTLLAPGRPVQVETAVGRVVRTVDGAVSADDLRDYTVSSTVPPTPAPLREGPDETDPRWLQLPTDLPLRVAALGRQLTAGKDRPSAVAAVEDWLRANATYRTDSPVPARGQDAVDRFLFVDRTGFCEQFAAAGTLLLRAAGIPARFVSGVAYGVPADQPGRRTYREADLHTWVEVFHPGVGWVASDPTDGTELAQGVGASLRARLATPLNRALRRVDTVPGGRPALAAGLLALTASAAALVRPRRTGRSVPAPALPAPGRPALAAFLTWDAALGARRRRRDESLRELTRRLGLDDAAREAVAVVERECYAPTEPGVDEVGPALEALRR